MADSKQLARLIGPTMIALGATEALNLEMLPTRSHPSSISTEHSSLSPASRS